MESASSQPMLEAVIAMVLVGIGGAGGAVLRHLVSTVVSRGFGHGAIGTFAVNLSGCLVIGLAGGLAVGADGRLSPQGAAWLLLVTGLLGGYTTVSSFSLQTLTLLRAGKGGMALVNIGASLLFCLSATVTGFAVTYSLGAVL
ncbi:CrcB family protein [Pelagibacterium sp. 26DY04]|uniref:CrcB family protein n=1 Tax=Pelagibacterium sp. 26DY04 TaxID=2967130 RepID=UPI0028156092|nr:CrcB family protein [Pelagibacterium sp. 26DY04]WMT87629.1 CrcB family protein [Pelagibacterium sp. 26DY04]